MSIIYRAVQWIDVPGIIVCASEYPAFLSNYTVIRKLSANRFNQVGFRLPVYLGYQINFTLPFNLNLLAIPLSKDITGCSGKYFNIR